MVTNPVDVMTYVTLKLTGLPKERVLDVARECADAELTEEADELRELLSHRLAHYVGVLREYGVHVPFGPRAHST